MVNTLSLANVLFLTVASTLFYGLTVSQFLDRLLGLNYLRLDESILIPLVALAFTLEHVLYLLLNAINLFVLFDALVLDSVKSVIELMIQILNHCFQLQHVLSTSLLLVLLLLLYRWLLLSVIVLWVVYDLLNLASVAVWV